MGIVLDFYPPLNPIEWQYFYTDMGNRGGLLIW
jgi:hypothetical protein